MLEAPTRSRTRRSLALTLLVAATALISSCATEPKRTALISDPDAQKESTIPWNKPAKWESGANIPGGIGGGPAGASINN